MKLYDDLVYRGLIKDTAGDDLEDKLNNEVLNFYWGTDPTADSLHIGHYSSLVTVKRLVNAGHKAILLVGGATGLIGDPKPNAERSIIQESVLNNNLESIKRQISRLFDNKVKVVNNYDWIKDLDLITFLREVGKYINVNYMINKDIISRRIETGITYAEFSYTLIQGYDFLHLFETENCTLQVEGSDQWGNITTGLELIKKKTGKDAYAFTMPLILDKSGKKFGKSEGNALYLDINKTSSFELYQYLINADDSLVESYLKVFTFLTKEEIEEVMSKHNASPENRLAQKTLAYEVVKDIHNEEEAINARDKSEKAFSKDIDDIINSDIETYTITGDNINIIDLIVSCSLAPSKSEARRLVLSGGITINNNKIDNTAYIINETGPFILKKGKKKVIKVITNHE